MLFAQAKQAAVQDFDIPKGKGFPFRTVHFFASTDKAKKDLDWKPAGTLEQDLPAQVCHRISLLHFYRSILLPAPDLHCRTLLSSKTYLPRCARSQGCPVNCWMLHAPAQCSPNRAKPLLHRRHPRARSGLCL